MAASGMSYRWARSTEKSVFDLLTPSVGRSLRSPVLAMLLALASPGSVPAQPPYAKSVIEMCQTAVNRYLNSAQTGRSVNDVVLACAGLFVEPACQDAWKPAEKEWDLEQGQRATLRCLETLCPRLAAAAPAVCVTSWDSITAAKAKAILPDLLLAAAKLGSLTPKDSARMDVLADYLPRWLVPTRTLQGEFHREESEITLLLTAPSGEQSPRFLLHWPPPGMDLNRAAEWQLETDDVEFSALGQWLGTLAPDPSLLAVIFHKTEGLPPSIQLAFVKLFSASGVEMAWCSRTLKNCR